jgi:hypothetical protein
MRPSCRGSGALAAGLGALVVFLVGSGAGVNAHLGAVCTATHEQRPQTVSFLFGTYHPPPAAGYTSVPGTAYIKTPQGHTYDFLFDSVCAPGADNWLLEEPVSYYRSRLLSLCVCQKVLECGGYDAATGMCTGTSGDCATIDPAKTEIECYGQNYNVPESEGAWGIQQADGVSGNCAYGAAATNAVWTSYVRTWYVATISEIFSGIFEVWSENTDVNMDPSLLYLRHTGEHPCTMCKGNHVFLPVTVADGGMPCTKYPDIHDYDSECVPRHDNYIISGYVCASACPTGEVSVSVYQCQNGDWDRKSHCIDAMDQVTCSAGDSANVGTGIIGIDGEACGQLSSVGTVCDIVCADGFWGYGKIACTDDAPSVETRRELLAPRRRRAHGTTALDGDHDAAVHHEEKEEEEEAQSDYRRRQLATVTGADCAGKVAAYETSWIGDGYCDSGLLAGPIFNCAAFNFDQGDCVDPTPSSWIVTDPGTFRGCTNIGNATDYVPNLVITPCVRACVRACA